MRLLLPLVLLSSVLSATLDAQAEGERWLFVPVGDAGARPPIEATDAVKRLYEVALKAGVPLWDPKKAGRTFERRHSAEPTAVGADEVRVLRRLDEEAVRAMAGGDHRTALARLEAAAAYYRRAPDAFNREDGELVLDLCLHHALARLETGVPVAEIGEQVRRCRSSVPPAVEINLLKHTNALIRQAVREANEALRSAPTGAIEVRGREGCRVLIDGREAGTISHGALLAENLVWGTHHVRLVCAQGRARVYTVELGERTEHLRIDPALDDTVYSRPMLWLRAPVHEPRLGAYGRLFSSVLENTEVVLVHVEHDAIVLRRLLRADAPAARAGQEFVATSLPLAAPPAMRLDGLRRLGLVHQPASSDASVAAPGPGSVRPAGAGARPPVRSGKGGLRAGYTLTALAGALSITSVALHLRARALRADDPERYNAFLAHRGLEIDKYDHPAARIGAAGMFVGLAASLSWSGLDFLIAERFERGASNVAPMLAISAAAGATLGAGIWQLRRMQEACETCRVTQDNYLETGLPLLVSGAALLTVPISSALVLYLPERAARRRPAQHVHLRPGPGALYLEGSF